MDKRYKIAEIKVSIVKTQSAGADYTDHAAGHWINDSIIANPMSVYNEYQESRSNWGMDVLKGIFIEVTTESGHQGYATAYGGYISSWIIKNHLNYHYFLFVLLVTIHLNNSFGHLNYILTLNFLMVYYFDATSLICYAS